MPCDLRWYVYPAELAAKRNGWLAAGQAQANELGGIMAVLVFIVLALILAVAFHSLELAGLLLAVGGFGFLWLWVLAGLIMAVLFFLRDFFR
ncbi:MAG: hypothetical protein OXG51_10050 [Gammaproteobacteria bacterium]|nr:hypothetical protein [Gammaproteobacteria bacterium]